LYHLPSVNQAEAEEELYLWRNKRIAEYGFLPYEEAIAIYSPLERADLPSHKTIELPGILSSAEKHYLVPVASWNEISDFPLLAEGFSGISDNLQADRIRLEFAVLCNTLIAADSFAITEDDDQIVLISRKAAGYLNIAMETICSDKSISPTDVLLKTICPFFSGWLRGSDEIAVESKTLAGGKLVCTPRQKHIFLGIKIFRSYRSFADAPSLLF